jgi:2'-5' RNA ligase
MSTERQADAFEAERVFVALWPSPGVRARLGEIADALVQGTSPARRVAHANFHLTLAFIGTLGRKRIADLAARLSRCSVSEFDWSVDRVGYFDRARVVWAGGPENDALHALADRVRELLDSAGVAYDRKPFVPHITLLRDVRHWTSTLTSIVPAIAWTCREPTLVRSVQTAGVVTYSPVNG